MSYEKLRNFIMKEMKLDTSYGIEKNYQPVVIKFLNQKEDGFATREQLLVELKNENKDRKVPSGAIETVTTTLLRHGIIKEKNDGFSLIGFDEFNAAHKAEITKRCEDKIYGREEEKYFILDNEIELLKAQKLFLENLKKYTTKRDRIIIGFPGPGKKLDESVDYISNANLWWHSHDLPDEEIPRFWNAFGPGEPIWGKNNSVALEINPPMKEISRRVGGAFVKNSEGKIFICHNGALGGGNTPGGFGDVYPHKEKWIQADDGRSDLRKLILISDITSTELPKNLAEYVNLVAKYKSGDLVNQKVPYYLLFRHKSEGNPYEDDPSGKVYHFPKIANYTKVVPGAKAIWYDRIDGPHYFWGYGTISKVNPRTDRDFDAIFEDFTLFEKEPESLEKHGKFLKKATPQVEEMITNRPGYNVQHSISEINKEIFDEIVGTPKISEDNPLEIGHKLFLLEMEQKEHKIPFTDFNHVDFVKEEVSYKEVSLEKSLKDLELNNWNQWQDNPAKICQAVRNAVSQKNSKNLIWAPPYNTEIGYFDELQEEEKQELGKAFFDFFKGELSIEERFDSLVESLEKVGNKPEIRLLAYLMFLLDSTKYFPIHPTNFDNLLEFYGFEKIKKVSWEKYSKYLDLASKLKPFLSQKFPGVDLSFIQIQSYMWVIAGAVSKNYWIVRPGTDGEDWENQKNNGFIGIHYYTMDLSEFAHQNNQLSKRKITEKIQEFRKEEGNEPLSQPQVDSAIGQFEKIYAVRSKDKIVAIGNNSTLLGVGNAKGKYQFTTEFGEMCHTVPVDWHDTRTRPIPKQEMRRTIKNLSIKDYVNILSSQTAEQKSQYQKFFDILQKKKQFFFYGPPGTGKTYTAKKIAESFTNSLFDDRNEECNQIEMVTFHQSFSYEEFVEGIRPHTDEVINQVTYPIEDGIFKRMCKCAEAKPELDFVLIIDEINRGNISKIFGELITLLENDKRGDKVTLPYSKKLFSVPKNIHLIGTMNTADRSLVHIDAALKRRFGQYELMPNIDLLDSKIGEIHLGRLLESLNQKIIDVNFRDNQIGHSYFMNGSHPITTVKELQFAFAYDIVPLLKDYFYDDDKILKTVLGDEFIDENRNIITDWVEDEKIFLKSLKSAYPEAFD
jgi:5-methylcytosine-specific restriction protein B